MLLHAGRHALQCLLLSCPARDLYALVSIQNYFTLQRSSLVHAMACGIFCSSLPNVRS